MSPSFSFENEGDMSLQNTQNHCPRYVVSYAWKIDILIFSFLHLAFVLWTNYILQQMKLQHATIADCSTEVQKCTCSIICFVFQKHVLDTKGIFHSPLNICPKHFWSSIYLTSYALELCRNTHRLSHKVVSKLLDEHTNWNGLPFFCCMRVAQKVMSHIFFLIPE